MSDKRLSKHFWTLLTAGALIATLATYTVCFTVRAGTVGVVKTFGAITRIKSQPGLAFKLPWPFQSVQNLDTRTRLLNVKSGSGEVITKDQFNTNVELAVGWHVIDAKKLLTRLPLEINQRDMLQRRIASSRQVVINKTSLDDIISNDPKQKERFIAFESEMLAKLNPEKLEADYGIKIDFLRVRNIAFPKTVTPTIASLMQKERERISKKYRTEGEKRAQIIKQEAESERDKRIADAKARAIILKGEGDAEAIKYYEIFKENPELANYFRELDAFTATLKKDSTVILPSNRAPFRIMETNPPKLEKISQESK